MLFCTVGLICLLYNGALCKFQMMMMKTDDDDGDMLINDFGHITVFTISFNDKLIVSC